MSKLNGKTVLITGGAQGIGLCAAREFAKAGCKLVLSDINAEALAKAAEELRALGAEVHTRQVDVAKREQVEECARWVENELGGLDVLVNNAGIGYSGEIAETPIEVWQKLMAVDFWGPLYHIYAFLPAMIARRSGQIVNVSSGQAYYRLPTWGAYATIKLAFGAMSEILHFEIKKLDIHVTTVYPFLVDTGFYKGIEGETFLQKLSMKFMPYYSMKPETVGRILFRATEKKKAVEFVNPLNLVALGTRSIPPVSDTMSLLTAHFLGKKADELASQLSHANETHG